MSASWKDDGDISWRSYLDGSIGIWIVGAGGRSSIPGTTTSRPWMTSLRLCWLWALALLVWSGWDVWKVCFNRGEDFCCESWFFQCTSLSGLYHVLPFQCKISSSQSLQQLMCVVFVTHFHSWIMFGSPLTFSSGGSRNFNISFQSWNWPLSIFCPSRWAPCRRMPPSIAKLGPSLKFGAEFNGWATWDFALKGCSLPRKPTWGGQASNSSSGKPQGLLLFVGSILRFYNTKYDAKNPEFWSSIEIPDRPDKEYVCIGVKASNYFMPKETLSEKGPGGGGWILMDMSLGVKTRDGKPWGTDAKGLLPINHSDKNSPAVFCRKSMNMNENHCMANN